MVTRRRSKPRRNWSRIVTLTSNAMDLEPGVFKKKDPKSIARSIFKSVIGSNRLNSSYLRAGISMITFYVNRAGKNLSTREINKLIKAKEEYRKLFIKKRSKTRT